MKTIALTLLLLPLAVVAADEWRAPDDARAVANPIAATSRSIAQGRGIYEKNCVICHGASGMGDGVGAAYLNPKPAKLSDPKIQEQTDGSLFWKITTGRNLMIGWGASISAEDRWSVIDYVRTLATKP